jgi:hypothetical protein
MNATFLRSSIFRPAVLLPVLLCLHGCGRPTSVGDLRTNPHDVQTFTVPADCETVYQRLARRARERYRFTNLATYQPGVSAKLTPDAQSATVTFFDAGGVGLRYVLTADLHATGDGTEVCLYNASSSSVGEALLWRQWAQIPLDTGPSDPNEAQQ